MGKYWLIHKECLTCKEADSYHFLALLQTMHNPLPLSPGAHRQPPSTSSGASGSSLSSPQPLTHTESYLDGVQVYEAP